MPENSMNKPTITNIAKDNFFISLFDLE